jgi:hypothetical protein
MFYRVHGLLIESTFPLPELPEAANGPADLKLEYLSGDQELTTPTRWDDQRRRPDGQIAWCLARQADFDQVRFPGHADFLVSKDSKLVRCRPAGGVPPETMRHLFLDILFPFLLSRHGGMVFHGSCIATERGAIAFLGGSGSGKSTLAASFVGAGFRLLADDTVLLLESGDQLEVMPSYPGLRLWPDAAAAVLGKAPSGQTVAHYLPKHRVGPVEGNYGFTGQSQHIVRICVLGKAGDARCSLQALTARDACLHLVRNTMSLDHDQAEVLKTQFETNTRLARRPIFRFLSYIRSFDVLPEVRLRVLEDLEKDAQT